MTKNLVPLYPPMAFPHDWFSKQELGDIEVAHDFFQHNYPEKLVRQMDLSVLEIQMSSFLSDRGDEHLSDIIYRTKMRDGDGYLACIIEHQSTPDRWMALRLQEYALHFMRSQVKQGVKKLPALFLTLFYHGKKKPYPFSCDFFDLFENPQMAKEYWMQPFHLIDLTQIPDDELLKQGRASVLGMLQKHIFDRDILSTLEKLKKGNVLDSFAEKCGDHYLRMVRYVLEAAECDDQEKVIELLAEVHPESRGDIMTIAQNLRQEGKREGILEGIEQGIEQGIERGIERGRKGGLQEGIQKTALNLLALNQDPILVSKATGLSLADLEKLRKEKIK